MKQLLTTSLLMCAALCAAQKQTAETLRLSGSETQAIVVRNLDNGATIVAHNADKLLTPASLTKLVTTAAAMQTLSAQERFRTKAYYYHPTRTLHIVGSGDPTFNSHYFKWHTAAAFGEQIANALREQGEKHIANITVDLTYQTHPLLPSARLWEDMGNYYGSVPQAINYADNTFTLTLSSPTKVGELCKIERITPEFTDHIECLVRSSSSKADSAYIYGISGGEWYISGSIPTGQRAFTVRGALPEPYKYFLKEIVNSLLHNGIKVIDEVSVAPRQQDALLLCEATSPTIEAICQQTNKHSINLFADALFLRLAAEKNDWNTSAILLQRFCQKVSPKAQTRFYDGSGLSPFTAISANTLVDVLSAMHKSPLGNKYRNTLAIAGRDGTLHSMGRGTAIEGKIQAKSGSMTGVLGYAGYFTDKRGRNLAFCIIVNHHTEKNADVRKEIVRWLTNNFEF